VEEQRRGFSGGKNKGLEEEQRRDSGD